MCFSSMIAKHVRNVKASEKKFLEDIITLHCVKQSEISILTKSAAFTEAPLSHRSFTLEEQPAMTVERGEKKTEKNAIIST